jgi:outer membrane protein assembly factor BamB
MYMRALNPSRQGVAKSIKTNIYLGLSLLLICPVTSLSAQARELLNGPQKVVVDVEHDRLLVSNFGNGAIVEIGTENKQKYFVENAGFVDGLEIVGNTIYGVGHSRKLFAYNLDSGEQVLDFHFTGVDSDYLSSVTSDTQGHLFISCPASADSYLPAVSSITESGTEYLYPAKGGHWIAVQIGSQCSDLLNVT